MRAFLAIEQIAIPQSPCDHPCWRWPHFASAPLARYNQFALSLSHSNVLRSVALLAPLALWASSCAVPLGPGYTIEKQSVEVHFDPAEEPRVEIVADYLLKNSGNQALPSLNLRLPGPRSFRVTQLHAEWDDAPLTIDLLPDVSPRTSALMFPAPWAMRTHRRLRILFEIHPAAPEESQLKFSPDAFYLPAEGWSPELLPAKGLFGVGGVPPKKWELSVRVPEAFLVHASGTERKTSRVNGEKTTKLQQRPADSYPFVLAGQYRETKFDAARQTIHVWSRAEQDAAALRNVQDSLTRAINAYDSAFGQRATRPRALWIAECPVTASCVPHLSPAMLRILIPADTSPRAEIASLDSVLVDLSAGMPYISVAAAPALAASWLGYGRNPAFWEQEPPLSALPAFASAIGKEAIEGPSVRAEIIRRALAAIPVQANKKAEGDTPLSREKSLLFFYALQDQYGVKIFSSALRHMIRARSGRGFGLDDLIAALDAETHQDVAPFVRFWLKHPGIPEDFRARYEDHAAPAVTSSKETTP